MVFNLNSCHRRGRHNSCNFRLKKEEVATVNERSHGDKVAIGSLESLGTTRNLK